MEMWEVEVMYDDYCVECKEVGAQPLTVAEWWAEMVGA